MRRFCGLATCWLCLGLLAGAGTASAQSAASASAPVAVQGAREAEALVERAKQRFAEGRFRDAVPLLERAHVLTHEPRLLFNLGVVHHKLSECEPAREYFERYLAEDPSGTARSEALSALEELYAHCPAPGVAATRVGATAKPAAPVERAASPAAVHPVQLGARPPATQLPSQAVLIVWGAGAALGVSALITFGLQDRAQHDIDALHARAAGKTWDAFEPERAALSENAQRYQGLSVLLGIGFIALAGTGAALWLQELPDDSSELAVGVSGVRYRAHF